jgi:phosphoribosylanthranilate isomerase
MTAESMEASSRMSMAGSQRPQIKICGLTSVRDAEACASAGADAVGFISYPRSPRHVGPHSIRRMTRRLPEHVCPVGVFVNETYERIMETADIGGLRAVQLHGQETPALVDALMGAGLIVIKALFIDGHPSLDEAAAHHPTAFLVECAGGPLPGGNALGWNWSDARGIPSDRPMVLAGGLSPDNIQHAIAAGRPDAVDVSSGVEAEPGRKDIGKVEAFCRSVRACGKVVERRVFR